MNIEIATQRLLVDNFADALSCWIEDGVSDLDILDCLATTGLKLSQAAGKLNEEFISLLAQDLFDCGHVPDDDDFVYKGKRDFPGEIADHIRLTLEGEGLTLVQAGEVSSDTYVDRLSEITPEV